LDKRRPDVSLVATGLSGSPWYWEIGAPLENRALPEISLKEPKSWSRLRSNDPRPPLVIGPDVELEGPDGLISSASGAGLFSVGPRPPDGRPRAVPAGEHGLYRGRYVYGETPDFFSTDLIAIQRPRAPRAGSLFPVA